jgi:phosphoribosylamine--glycine ligase
MTQKKGLKFLIVSKWGDSLDIAYRLKNEQHEVLMSIQDRDSKEIGFGFVRKTNQWQKYTDWADVIVFDYTGFGVQADQLRKQGKLVFGGSTYTDQLELDRNFGHLELIKHKIKTIPSKEFTNFPEAIEYIRAHPDCYVIKPCGETQEYKQLLFVGKDDQGHDVIKMLEAYQKTWGATFGVFQIQRRVKGVEVAISGFFNGHNFVRPINVSFEHKKLFPNELGVSTGEMGTSMFWSEKSPIFERTLLKMEQTLATHNFVGHIDINTIVNGNGIYPLEFTSRFGYPQINIQLEGITENFGNLLLKIAQGEEVNMKVKKGFQVGAYMVVPPFPFDDKKSFEIFSKDSVVLFKTPNREGIHPIQVKNINGQWLITGNSGIVLLIVGTGLTMKEAQKNMYNRIANIIINNSYYRNDIGNRWAEDSDKLLSWGLL